MCGGEGTPDLPAVEGGGGAVARETGGGGTVGAFPSETDKFCLSSTIGLAFSAWAASSFSLFSSSISALLRTIELFS